MKVKKKCPECREPLTVPGNIFTEVTCPSCGTGLQVDYGAFTEVGSPSRFSPESRQGSDFASVAWLLRAAGKSVQTVRDIKEAVEVGERWKLLLKKVRLPDSPISEKKKMNEFIPFFEISL